MSKADQQNDGLGVVFFNEGGRVNARIKVNGEDIAVRGAFDKAGVHAESGEASLVLSLDERFTQPHHPALAGTLTVNGHAQRVLAWRNTTTSGTKILGLSPDRDMAASVDCPF